MDFENACLTGSVTPGAATISAPWGIGDMFHRGCILCLGIVVLSFCGNAAAAEPGASSDLVLVELVSGQLIRAQSIESDANSPGRVILSVTSAQIQMSRNLSWSRVNRLSAPLAMLDELQVPPHVKVIDSVAQPDEPHERPLDPTPTDTSSNAAPLTEFPLPPRPTPTPMPTLLDSPYGAPLFLPELLPEPILPGPCEIVMTAECCPVRCDPGVVVGVWDEDPYAASRVEFCRAVDTNPRELIVAARGFNRDGLSDWNSLEVLVQGRTERGEPCPVRGSLKCTLWVRRARLVRAYAETYFEEPRELVRLGQWSQFLDGMETDANGVQKVVLALPPQSPDHDLGLSQFGLLTVELDIPGQGRLATTSEPIALRQFGPIRSRGVVDFGSSILPLGSVSEGLSDAGHWPAPLSGLRPDSRRFTVQP
jgi:hypothetical protein